MPRYRFIATLCPILNRCEPVGIGGGGKRDRTADLLHAMQALSQLSYTPIVFTCVIHSRDLHGRAPNWHRDKIQSTALLCHQQCP